MKVPIRSFRANNILGNVNYKLDVKGSVSIIVGPNGTGKSTFINIFYLFITKQWSQLIEYNFSDVELLAGDIKIGLSRLDLVDFENSDNISPRLNRYISTLRNSNKFTDFVSSSKISKSDADYYSTLLGVPTSEVIRLRRMIQSETSDLFRSKVIDAERQLESLNLGRVLYLPTYRRIEKDLRSIFPDIEERMRTRLSPNQSLARRGATFQEIVSFGMDDVKSLILEYTKNLNALSKTKSNAAAQEYIRDMVQGKIKDYSISIIRDLDASIISEFVARLDDQLISEKDKNILFKDITSLRERKRGKPSKDMQYLGFFVEKMLNVYVQMNEEERPFVDFTNVVSRYIADNKQVIYRNYEFHLESSGLKKELSLDDLSSGEKQIVSMFAYLHLLRDQENIVIIDEPELSLSVPWQRKFLPDILASGRCSQLFAVTHSPFVFDNEVRNQIVDVRKLSVQ